MVAPWVEEALVDGSPNETVLEVLLLLFGTLIDVEHLRKGVSMILQPKLILPLYIFVRSVKVRKGLRVVYNLVLILVHWPRFWLDFSRKPIMPTLEAVVWCCFITDEVIIIDPFEGLGTQPPSFLPIHVPQRFRGIEHFSISIEDLLQMHVDLRDAEEETPMFGI